MLLESTVPLVDRHDLFMFDLDGVIYVGPDAVEGVPAHLDRMRAQGVTTAFVTNNASRPASTVADHLRALGIRCEDSDVVNSAQAAAQLLAGRHPAGSQILVLGGDGLVSALEEVDLVPIQDTSSTDVVELLTGFGPDVVWSDIMRAARRVKDGLPWTASNTDLTFPTTGGALPGHGMLVDLISRFSGVVPAVAGKPERPLLDATIARHSAERPLMVGDRLDTDIEGGRRAEVETLLVLTGVSGLEEIVAAQQNHRPDFICATLADAFAPQPVPVRVADSANFENELGGWSARVRAGGLEIEGAGSPSDWWRLVAVTSWQYLDQVGDPVTLHNVVAPVPPTTPAGR